MQKHLTYSPVLILFLFLGCSSSGESRRGKLSDAMEKASEDNAGDRKVATEPVYQPPFREVEGEVEPAPPDSSAGHGQETISSSGKEPSVPTWVGLRLGGGTLKAADFEGIGELGISVGKYLDDQIYGEVWGFISGSSLTKTAALNKSIKDGVGILGLGIEGKYFLTPSHTLLGPYLFAGLNFSQMSWEYQNAITADTYDDFGNVIGTETIYGDGLSGLDLFVGVGFHLFQFSGFHIGGELTPGVILWSGTTTEGFDNDIFDPFFYLKLRAHFNIAF